jgi:hypothetical protein
LTRLQKRIGVPGQELERRGGVAKDGGLMQGRGTGQVVVAVPRRDRKNWVAKS